MMTVKEIENCFLLLVKRSLVGPPVHTDSREPLHVGRVRQHTSYRDVLTDEAFVALARRAVGRLTKERASSAFSTYDPDSGVSVRLVGDFMEMRCEPDRLSCFVAARAPA